MYLCQLVRILGSNRRTYNESKTDDRPTGWSVGHVFLTMDQAASSILPPPCAGSHHSH